MTNTIVHLSEKPWSDYTKADYSIEQWHAACLIHQHDGPPTSKEQCKIPVKTPSGAVNRNGVHAAAAALAGARGGVHASAVEKSSAARALVRYYNQMDEKPPPSLLSHANKAINTFIEHFGSKGMKWGVRKDKGHEGESAKSKKIAKLDKKFTSKVNDPKTIVGVYNRGADLTNKNDIARINNKPEYKGKDFTKDSPLRQKYYNEHKQAFLKNLQKAADELGTSASGNLKYSIFERPNDDGWDLVIGEVKHADVTYKINVIKDKMGHIIRLETQGQIEHSSFASFDEFIEHYGKKGMRWGVRKRAAGAKSASDFKATVPLRNRKTHELSNKQIQKVNARINLEQNYRRLNPTKVDQGRAIAKGVIAGLTTAASLYALANSPAGKAAIAAGKKALQRKL
jgi:hypothetical protein